MKRYIKYIEIIYAMAFLVLLASCSDSPDHAEQCDCMPYIYPDYIGVTVPVDIAPMNFNSSDADIQCMDVIATGSKGGSVHTNGDYADFDVSDWHELTEQNRGGYIKFSVCVKKNDKWKQYKDFKMYVSRFSLDDYGVVYRRIAPGYEVGGDIGIYQRDIHDFDESAIFQESAVPGECMNCHTANHCDANTFNMQIRGEHGGTLIQHEGKLDWINPKTDSTVANTSYAYWHPNGKYCAFSTNKINQFFFVGKKKRIEVYDPFSNVLVLNVAKNQLLLSPLLQTKDMETYPAFSPDGKSLYYCSSPYHEVPREYEKMKYSLCRISFDAAKEIFGNKVDTLINARTNHKSIAFPRPSYDGRWLMYSVLDYGNFPVNHKEADLWLLDLKTGKSQALNEVNSNESESFHNWCSKSHWFVFASRRENGMYTQLFFSCIDDKGRATKPFLMPQRNPRKYYDDMMQSYNCPDFTKQKIKLDAHSAARKIMNGKPKQVTIK